MKRPQQTTNDHSELFGFSLEAICLETEINYLVSDSTGYFCRLVPGYAGFELSKLDKAMGNEPQDDFIALLSDFIVRKDA